MQFAEPLLCRPHKQQRFDVRWCHYNTSSIIAHVKHAQEGKEADNIVYNPERKLSQ